jgi:hypothetical protein
MEKDFSRIKLFWREKLRRLPKEFVDGLDLDADSSYYLTDIGLPDDLGDLAGAIEINFYFDRERITKREFKGIIYCIIGDDSGAQLGISLTDNQLYAVDFDNSLGIDPVCFVNSAIDKFIETLQLFIEFKNVSQNGAMQETELIELMKAGMKDIDKKCLENEKTWWGIIVNEAVRD